MPSVKAFTSNQHGHRYTLRQTGGEPMKMAAVETITDLLLEIMEVVTLMLKSLLIRKVISHFHNHARCQKARILVGHKSTLAKVQLCEYENHTNMI